MAFFGGRFIGAQCSWKIFERRAFKIVQTFDRMDYLYWRLQPEHVFTGHRNILHVFAPLVLRPSSPKHVLTKVRVIADVRELTMSCKYSIMSRSEERIPRLLASTLHGENPNEVEYGNLLYVGSAAKSDLKYILVIKEDISFYSWLHAYGNASCGAANITLSRWFACFTCMEWLVRDQSWHLVALRMTILTK